METATQLLHRLTSYERGTEWTEPRDDPRIVTDLVPNDMSRFPWFFKRYEKSLRRLPLPRELPQTLASATDVLSGTANVRRRSIDLEHLARLLYLAAGVVRTSTRRGTKWFFRAAGSAGARFPLELYVAAPEGAALPAGVHWYDALDHSLVRVGPPPHGGAPTLVVTGVPWRTGWRYRERGFRHVYWDAGTMLSQLLAAADSAGLATGVYTVFPDSSTAALVGADGVHEWPVAVVALGDDVPALEASDIAQRGEVDAAPLEFPLVTAAQHAGERDALGSPWQRGPAVEVPARADEPVEKVVLRRGSQRRMDPARALSEEVLITCLRASLRAIGPPHFVVIHNVAGVPPGLYRASDPSVPLRSGDLRAEVYRVCLDQGLARDAAFVIIGATDVSALDEREYREAQMAAGLVEGRLHLLAYALGAGASGMTFIDAEIPKLLGEPVDGLLFTCVGAPDYRSTPGGRPGAPASVRMVTPRVGD